MNEKGAKMKKRICHVGEIEKGNVVISAKGEGHDMKNTGKEDFIRRLRGARVNLGAKALSVCF